MSSTDNQQVGHLPAAEVGSRRLGFGPRRFAICLWIKIDNHRCVNLYVSLSIHWCYFLTSTVMACMRRTVTQRFKESELERVSGDLQRSVILNPLTVAS